MSALLLRRQCCTVACKARIPRLTDCHPHLSLQSAWVQSCRGVSLEENSYRNLCVMLFLSSTSIANYSSRLTQVSYRRSPCASRPEASREIGVATLERGAAHEVWIYQSCSDFASRETKLPTTFIMRDVQMIECDRSAASLIFLMTWSQVCCHMA